LSGPVINIVADTLHTNTCSECCPRKAMALPGKVLTTRMRGPRKRYTIAEKAAKLSKHPADTVRFHRKSHSKYGGNSCPVRKCQRRITRNVPTTARQIAVHEDVVPSFVSFVRFGTGVKPRYIPATNNNCQDRRSK
jgi:hypothetical protein